MNKLSLRILKCGMIKDHLGKRSYYERLICGKGVVDNLVYGNGKMEQISLYPRTKTEFLLI